MNNITAQISQFLNGISTNYNLFWDNLNNNPMFIQYKGFPFQIFGEILAGVLFAVLLISFVFRNKRKRYFISTSILSITVSALSIGAITLVHKNGVQLELVDKTYGLLISSMGLSFYAFVYSIINVCKNGDDTGYNSEKAILPILFYLFTLGFSYTYAKHMYAMQSIDIIKSTALVLVSPLWLLYAPYSAIFCAVYIFVIPLILTIKKDKQIVQNKRGGKII